MAKNIGEALRILNKIGTMSVDGMNLDSTNKVTSYVNHRFREEIIIPYVALDNNISFLLSKGEKEIITADGLTCKVIECQEKHICELEDKIKQLYNGIDCWSFIKRWYVTKKSMDSLHFIYLKLEKL